MARSIGAVLILCLASGGFPPMAAAESVTPVRGTISEDATWGKAHSPYELSGVVTVARRARLTIGPGVEVRAQPDAALVVRGVLRAEGSVIDPVVFRAASPSRRWEGIHFSGTAGMRREDSRSVIAYAAVRNARSAVAATYDSPTLRDVAFTRNRRAVELTMPAADVEFQRVQFFRNDVALSGWTAATVSVSGSDFYDNRRNLVAGPKRPYDCIRDDGVWALHGNDILRGPDDSWYSDDVASVVGSHHSGFDIDLRFNHWNTLDDNEIQARVLDAEDVDRSWTDGLRKRIIWDPLSPSPLTAWVPPGAVSQPSIVKSYHPDAPMWAYVTSPRDTACVSRSEVSKISGYAFGQFSRVEWVDVAIKRLRGDDCLWTTTRRVSLRDGGCNDPVWLRANGEREGSRYLYRLPLLRSLPRGRYVAYARSNGEPGLELGRNKIRFRIRGH